MSTEPTSRAAVWSRYWSTGASHSCATSFGETYDGPLASYWREGFASLPRDARILDIASGNGALPRLMLALQVRDDLRCDAVDLADVAPAWLDELRPEQRSRVRFHPGCAAEALPFADASFQLVVSQWGLEYSDLERSVPELLRVLAPGGEVRLLMHHEQALPVQLAADEIEQLEWLIADRGFATVVAELLGPMAMAASAEGRARLAVDADANAARERFNALQHEMGARIARGGCVDALDEARQASAQLFALAAQRGEATGRLGWQNWRRSLDDSLLRLRELRSHAMGEDAARALACTLAAQGSYELAPLHDRDAVMGWALSVKRRP